MSNEEMIRISAKTAGMTAIECFERADDLMSLSQQYEQAARLKAEEEKKALEGDRSLTMKEACAIYGCKDPSTIWRLKQKYGYKERGIWLSQIEHIKKMEKRR